MFPIYTNYDNFKYQKPLTRRVHSVSPAQSMKTTSEDNKDENKKNEKNFSVYYEHAGKIYKK